MSASLDVASNWNFRVFDKRLIIVKTKNESVRKVAVLDVLTNLMFAVEVPDMISMKELSVDKEYLANLRVYTAKNVGDVDKDFINFYALLSIQAIKSQGSPPEKYPSTKIPLEIF